MTIQNNENLDQRISNLKKKIMQNAITLKKKIKNGTLFKFKPFSLKQKKILTWWTEKSPVKDKNRNYSRWEYKGRKNTLYVFIVCVMGYVKF